MRSLVLDLQQEAYNSGESISSLLRKAYAVARKLKITEFEQWIYSELHGYKCDYNEIPDYRIVSGNLRAFNACHGWVPVIIDDTKLAEILNNRKIPDPITNLEVLVGSNSNSLMIQLPNDIRKQIAEWAGVNTNFSVFVRKSQVETILETVRNVVLEWSLKLEEDGIMGEDMKFTDNEKTTAQENSYTVNNFYGDILKSQIQQNSNNSTQNMQNKEFDIAKVNNLIKLLKDNYEQINYESNQKEEVQAQIKTIEAQLLSNLPNRTIIIEGFKTIRNILEGVTGSIVASGLIHHLGLFIGQYNFS